MSAPSQPNPATAPGVYMLSTIGAEVVACNPTPNVTPATCEALVHLADGTYLRGTLQLEPGGNIGPLPGPRGFQVAYVSLVRASNGNGHYRLGITHNPGHVFWGDAELTPQPRVQSELPTVQCP